jgi:hypothetical protein
VFDPPVDDPRLFSSMAVRLIDALYKPSLLYAKAGVSLSKIREKRVEQGHLYARVEHNNSLNDVIDEINQRYGRATVRTERQVDGEWQMANEARLFITKLFDAVVRHPRGAVLVLHFNKPPKILDFPL